MKEKSKSISFIKVMGKLFPMIFKAAPAMLFIVGAVSVFHGISLYFTTVFSQKFFDSVTSAISAGSASRAVIVWGIALGAIVILGQVMNGLDGFMGVPCSQKAAGSLKLMIHNKASSISPVEYEKTDTLDDINKAHEGSAHSTDLVIQLLSFATFYIPYTIFMSLYLFRLKPILAISLFAIFLPIALAQIIKDKSFAKLERDSAPLRREYEYYEECITSRQYFKETYIWGAADFFKGLYMSALAKLNKKTIAVEVKCKIIEFSMKALALIGYFFVLYLLTDALLSRDISVGAFAAVFASIAKIFSMLEVFVDREIAWIARNMGSIRNFVRFVSLPDRKGADSSVNISNGISLRNVSFKYPDAQSNAVSHVTLDIKPNETIAIVGENGAGKTTLVKLIVGIYTPDDGDVLLGGNNTKEVSSKSIYNSISGVFQKFQKYQMLLSDNIKISDMKSSSSVEEGIDSAARKANLAIDGKTFPDGYDTMLSREFNGVDLSGGQWQRVAIARGFYKIHDMIILDEPTAAIDPIEETRIYRKFAEISKGKTSIIVTHRLGSAKIAQRILVMDKGRLVDIGTHSQLMKKGGKYAHMFSEQSKWYR